MAARAWCASRCATSDQARLGYVVDPVTLLRAGAWFSRAFFLAAATGSDATRARDRLARREVWAMVFLGFIGYYFASRRFLACSTLAGLGPGPVPYPTLVVVLR